MSNGVVSEKNNAGMEYQEPAPVTPQGDPKDVTVAFLFSPFSYDLLKDYSSWKWMNAYQTQYNHYEYGRFISLLEWDSKNGFSNASLPVDFKDVPASDEISDRKKIIEQNPLDMTLFVDCSSEKFNSIDGEASLKEVNKVTKENKGWDDLAGYLSMALSELKDHLFRLHKKGHNGYVHFEVAAYQPLSPLLFALLDIAGIRIKECAEHDDFISYLKGQNWFANFKPWMEKYEWEMDLKQASLFQGYFYGVTQETESSINSRYAKECQKGLRKLYDFDKKLHGGLSHGDLEWDREDCKKWKESGEFTIAELDDGDWPVHPHRFGGDQENMSSVLGVSYWSQEEPVVKVFDQYWTEKQLKKVRDRFMRRVGGDGAPEWSLKFNKFTQRGEIKVDQKSYQGKVTSKDLKKELDDWKQYTYDPQMAENKAVLNEFDKRENDAIEKEVWKRKSMEDEGASDKWNVDKNLVVYHGKSVRREVFEAKVNKLNQEFAQRLEAIENAENLETLEVWLTVLSVLQIVCGIITLGTSSLFAGVLFAVIDAGFEVGKAALQFHYDKNYTMGKALYEHSLGVIMDVASCVLFIPALFRIRKVKASQKLADNAHSIPSPTQAPPPAPEPPKLQQNTRTYSYTTEATPMSSSYSQQSTPIASEMTTASTEKAADPIYGHIKPAGNNYEILGMATTRNAAKNAPNGANLHVGSGLSNDKVTWVKIRRDNGSVDVLRIDNKKQPQWLKNHTGKDANEWNAYRTAQNGAAPNPTVVQDKGPVANLKQQAKESFSYSGPNEKVTFDELAKSGYSPETGPTTIETTNIKYDEYNYSSFGDMLRFHGSGIVKPKNIATPKAYHILKKSVSEEQLVIDGVNLSITKHVTTFYTGYSTSMNILQLVNSAGICYDWAKTNIGEQIDGEKVEDLFDEPLN